VLLCSTFHEHFRRRFHNLFNQNGLRRPILAGSKFFWFEA